MSGKIVVLFFCLLLLQAEPVLGQMNISKQIRDIYVFDDKGDGVESELFKIDDVGIRTSLGLTDKHGYKQVYLLCKSEDLIGAVPKNGAYFQRMINCTINKTIKLELGKKNVYKLIFNSDQEINVHIIAISPEEIEIVPEDCTQSVTIKFNELVKILEAKNYISPGEVTGRAVAGAGFGAVFGAIFFGIGAIPGAIIGGISGGATSPTTITYENDVLSKYYTQESSLR